MAEIAVIPVPIHQRNFPIIPHPQTPLRLSH
jgi:hypothetical protein